MKGDLAWNLRFFASCFKPAYWLAHPTRPKEATMYDSRSSHPRNRGARWDRHDGDLVERRQRDAALGHMEVVEGVIAYLDGDMPARTFENVSMADLNRAHAEALRMNASQHLCSGRDCGLADWECALLDGDTDAWLDEYVEDRDDDCYFEGLDTPNMNTFDDCWMPLVTIEQAREHFGRDWLSNGFHIDSHNARR